MILRYVTESMYIWFHYCSFIMCCSSTSSSRWRPYCDRATRIRDFFLTEDLLRVSRERNSWAPTECLNDRPYSIEYNRCRKYSCEAESLWIICRSGRRHCGRIVSYTFPRGVWWIPACRFKQCYAGCQKRCSNCPRRYWLLLHIYI